MSQTFMQNVGIRYIDTISTIMNMLHEQYLSVKTFSIFNILTNII